MWEKRETFRITDIMENCCDVALYPLGLEPFERPMGLQLSSHLSDKEAGLGRVLPDVMFAFQPLIPPLHMHTQIFGFGFFSFKYCLGIIALTWKQLTMLAGCVSYHWDLEESNKSITILCGSLLCLAAPYVAKGCQ